MGVGKMGVGKMGVMVKGKTSVIQMEGLVILVQNVVMTSRLCGSTCSYIQYALGFYTMSGYGSPLQLHRHAQCIVSTQAQLYQLSIPMTPMLNCIPLTLDGCVLAVLLQSSKSCFSSPPKVLLQKAFVIGDLSLQGASTGHNY